MPRRSEDSALNAGRAWLFAVALTVGACAARTTTVVRPPRTPPVRCADPVEGSWEGEAFLPAFDQWTRLRLEVRRDPRDPARLTGEIVSRYWSADASGTDPPRCSLDSYDRTVRMAAEGRAQGQRFEFAGTSWRAERAACGAAAAPGSYALDRLVGTLDPSGLQIRAVDADGDRAVEAGFTFWRAECAVQDPLQARP